MFKSFLVLFFCVGLSVAQYIDFPSFNKECGPNEELDCQFSCPPEKTCRNREETIHCSIVVLPCEHKCICKEGFIRNFEGGDCIPEKLCDKCPGANEHYACGGLCDDVCSILDSQNKTSCPYTDCEPSCYCDDGYARDESGNCIPVDKC